MKDQINPEVEAILRELDITLPNSQDGELPPLLEITDNLALNGEPPSPEAMDAGQEPTEAIEGEVVEEPPLQPGIPLWLIIPISLITLAIATIVVVFIL